MSLWKAWGWNLAEEIYTLYDQRQVQICSWKYPMKFMNWIIIKINHHCAVSHQIAPKRICFNKISESLL